MTLIDLARKVLHRQSQRHATVFAHSRQEILQFLKDLGDPHDDEERSFFQYLAQRSEHRFLFVLYNIASFPMYFIQKQKLQRRHADYRNSAAKCTPKTLVYYIYDVDRSLMPQSLNAKYPNHIYAEDETPMLAPEDVELLAKIGKRRPFSFYYRLKVMMRLGINRTLIEKYNPLIIAQCGEYSFASSLCTHQLEQEERGHFNLLHGEKLLSLRDSYPRFTQFYVWSEHYVELFETLRCPKEQFVIECPPSLKPHDTHLPKTVDYTYYLANETGPTLETVARVMLDLSAKDKVIRLRPHPRYTERAELAALVPEEMIEPEGLPLETSLGRSRGAISLYSTVLNQAAALGLEIVLDDIKAPELYQQLRDLGYARIHEPHRRLSSLLEEVPEGRR